MKATAVKVLHEEPVGRCCVCNKPVTGFYGRWGNSGTCSRVCEAIQSERRKEVYREKVDGSSVSVGGTYGASPSPIPP